ncbi:hypothetical protein ASPVEDRAFT_41577 [Aspergillus versicolor CBS 583.65]|uniref:Uncharacterized protein n=1 Tax=Aspergillus versicolor CBS 583.65 TaxID=1036611 RepID=A0A1L9PKN9_ASPVE|nr:uncharacterized protein ASPVEDRAFT_41577 [Aspergillus versicolor CBS 583.65]OJJ02089.1 hypothetical protein ASPVEDRAFT_41577 [Aspergillus versicolor CBS 583.65]
MVDNTPQWLKGETLRAYMAIVHQQRKKRGESNCVVYGVHTDTEFFDFFKIDSASKLSTLYGKETSRFWFYPFGQGKDPEAVLATQPEESREGYKRLFWNAATQSWRVYMNFTEDVVTLFENILDDGVQDCYGITAI